LPSLRNRVEAILFVADRPVAVDEICEATGEAGAAVRRALRELADASRDRGFVLREVAGGWRLATEPGCREDVERFLLPPRTHMSQASLETLAIVAYLQPVTRAEIESLRGVNVDGVMMTLEERRLVRELGRKETVGRPITYGTTQIFLEAFGMQSLDDLPKLPEGAPKRVNGEVIAFPLSAHKAAEVAQIHESIEGHEDEVPARAEAKLAHSVAQELADALEGLP
jgi:segregation and condensation protein B